MIPTPQTLSNNWRRVQVIGYLFVVAVLLRLLGLPWTLAWLGKSAHYPRIRQNSLSPHQMAHCMSNANNLLPRPFSCLVRSCTLWWLLRRQGILTDLRIGVRTHQGQLQAHAWVEYGHTPLHESPLISQQFKPFGDAIPPATPSQQL